MSQCQPCLPETIIKRVFETINRARGEYGIPLLSFSKELSFIAGEFAVHLSTNQTPFNHTGFTQRHLQAPLAVTFTENIACVTKSKDPAHDAVFQWLSHPTSFTRIISPCTDTGIGAAESENGSMYIIEIFATMKSSFSHKDKLLIAYRYINELRRLNNIKTLTISFTATSKLIETKKDALFGITPISAKSFFQMCTRADSICETFDHCDKPIETFLEEIKSKDNMAKLLNPSFTEMSFVMGVLSSKRIIGCVLLGECSSPYRPIPPAQANFPSAYQCLMLINDYRMVHKFEPIVLSHQLCHIAQKYSEKIKNRQAQLQVYSVLKKLKVAMPNSVFKCGCSSIPMTIDPIRELFLIWISNNKSKQQLLNPENKHLGFGMAIYKNDVCYATWIIGIKKDISTPYSRYEFFPGDRLIYESISSDEQETTELRSNDPMGSFHLTE